MLCRVLCCVLCVGQVKTKKMSHEKRAKVDAQIAKLEKALRYVEQQRVSDRGRQADDGPACCTCSCMLLSAAVAGDCMLVAFGGKVAAAADHV